MRKASAGPASLVVALGTLTLIATRSFSAPADLTIQEIVKRVAPSVVTILVYDKAGDPVRQGTGFMVAPHLVLTNEHVVEGAYSIKVLSLGPDAAIDHTPRLLKIRHRIRPGPFRDKHARFPSPAD